MVHHPCVTIGLPAYQSEPFIEPTLFSILHQTYQNIEVIISLDGPQPALERICRPFLEDSRFHLIVQKTRLGWVGNINWLMKLVKTPYWYCQPHDDLVDPGYVEILLDHAERAPGAAVVYCDMVGFGDLNLMMMQPSVTGSPFARQLALLRKHYPAVAFRGLTRLEALRCSGGVPTNEFENFAVDTVWMAGAARWGELQRVPMELYHKRYHAQNEHSQWFGWSVEKRSQAWIVHCADMLEQAMLAEATPDERRSLWRAAVERLVSSEVSAVYLETDRWTPPERATLFDRFMDYLKGPRRAQLPIWLGAGWPEIQAFAGGISQL